MTKARFPLSLTVTTNCDFMKHNFMSNLYHMGIKLHKIEPLKIGFDRELHLYQ